MDWKITNSNAKVLQTKELDEVPAIMSLFKVNKKNNKKGVKYVQS